MSASASPLWAANSRALRDGHNQVMRISRRLVRSLLSLESWTSRSSLVYSVKQACAPEILARLCQREAEIGGRPNRLGPDEQAWAGAKRAVGLVITYWRSVGIIETRGDGDSQEVRLLRIPRVRRNFQYP